jgi:putative SOS response-associated peptidase YedK
MCGRYTLRANAEILSAEFFLTEVPVLRPRFNVAPTQQVAVVTADRPDVVQQFRWGLVPGWAKDLAIGNRMINARADTLPEKPAFRNALKRRRCLVLADGFFEWKVEGKKKTPIFVHRKDDRPFAFAGLWESWRPADGAEPIHSCTFITTEPNALMAQFHDRMPVILPPESRGGWLSNAVLDADALARLLRPLEGDDLEAFPVSTAVNKPANDFPECILRAA